MKRLPGVVGVLLAVVLLTVVAAANSDVSEARDSPQWCRWRQVLSLPGAVFEDVAVSRNDVWAVGWSGHRKAYPLVSHWDGVRWTTTAGATRGKNQQVVARSTADVWVSGLDNGRYVLRHSDGRRWKTEFRAVDLGNSASPQDLWMMERSELIAVHSDGSQTRIPLPPPVDFYGGFAVDPRGTVWVDDDNNFRRWNGRRWSTVPHAPKSQGGGVMAAASSVDAWSVGNSIEHWNGSTWRLLRHGGEDQVMHDVDALSGRALLVGQDWGMKSAHGVIAEWKGSAWGKTTYLGKRSPDNNAVSNISTVEAIMGVAFANAGESWAVGYGGFGDRYVGVIFRGSCSW